jgi:release factor glutamine methyltransferase
LIKRVAAGEPVAYLTGQREFYSLSFKVTPDVLIPRLETELLVDVALQVAKKIAGPAKLWDICTGSGCVAIAAAHYAANLRVLATDVSEKALAVAAENVATHKLADRVTLAQADLLNLPAEADEWGEVHVITANPPYVSESQMKDLPKVVLAEPELALKAGATGLEVIEKIIAQAPPRLAAGGTLAIEMGAGQASAVFELLKAGPFEDIRILKDSAGIERTAVAAKRG